MKAKYYKIEPEVSGGWGKETIADTTNHPPVVSKLDYQFDGWLGDSILESFPCYIVTEELAKSISRENLSGYDLSDCKISKSDIFEESHPGQKLPNFVWLKVKGVAGTSDFGIGKEHELVVSEKALKTLKNHSLRECEIEAYNV